MVSAEKLDGNETGFYVLSMHMPVYHSNLLLNIAVIDNNPGFVN